MAKTNRVSSVIIMYTTYILFVNPDTKEELL